MDIRKIKKLIELLEASDAAEIEVREGEEAVRISRPRGQAPAVAAGGHAAAPPATGPGGAAPRREDRETEGGHVVRSPLVGIYYAAPHPEQPPYVEVGQSVAKGDVLCIIEAMKVMNHIGAEVSGTVVKVLAENGEPVEYDQPLFVIRES